MADLVTDTHSVIWYLIDLPRLSGLATQAFDAAAAAGDRVYIPSIVLVEMIYLTEKARIQPRALDMLLAALMTPDSLYEVVPLDFSITQAVRRIPRDIVPDMPDRIIAATALHLGLSLITRDRQIQASGIPTIW